MTRCSTGRATQKYKGSGTDLSDILETQGDIIYADSTLTAENLSISGTPGDVLKVSVSGVPEWGTSTSQWVTSGSDISYITGNVGIGTTTPDANLHVNGNAFVNSNLALGGVLSMGTVNVVARHTLSAITATGNLTPNTVIFDHPTTAFVTTANVSVGGELSVVGNVAVDTNTLYVDSVNNRVGIGTTTPNKALHVSSDGTDPTYIKVVGSTSSRSGLILSEGSGAPNNVIMEYDGTGSGAGNYLAFYSDVSGWATKGTGLNFVPENGRVGIGTSVPGYTLDVAGDINLSGSLRIGGVAQTFGGGGSGSSPWVTSGNDISYSTGDVTIDSVAGVTPQWFQTIAGAGSEYGYSVAVDSSGNVYVIGKYNSTSSTVSLGNSLSLPVSTKTDAFIVKYNSSGTAQWFQTIAGTGDDTGNSIAVDSSGNVYVTGKYISSSTVSLGNGIELPISTQDDAFIVKYDTSGTAQWAQTIAGSGADYGNSIAVDSSGNVYVNGSYNSTSIVSLGNNLNLPASNGFDVFVVKYDTSGTAQWFQTIAGTGNDKGNSIAVDSSGNVYIIGYYYSTSTVSLSSTLSLPVSTYTDGFIIKYDTSGLAQWFQTIAGVGTDIATGIAVDSSGNVYVTGDYSSSSTVSLGTGVNLPISTQNDAFIVKYNSSGTAQWAQTISGGFRDYGYGVAADSSGNVYVIGRYNSTSTVSLSSTLNLPISTGYDVFVVKYDTSGTAQWYKIIQGTSTDSGQGIAVDSSGGVYVTGYYASTSIVPLGNNLNLPITTYGDVFIVKYSPSPTLFVDTANSNVGIGTSTPGAELHVSGTGAIIVPNGTTVERPGTAVTGMIRYNTETGHNEVFTVYGWDEIATREITITSISPTSYDVSIIATQVVTVTGVFFDSLMTLKLLGQDGTTVLDVSDYTFDNQTKSTTFKVPNNSATLIQSPYKIRITSGLGTVVDSAGTLSIQSGLYTFTSHTFTRALGDVRYGPTFAQMKTAYNTTVWYNDPNFFNEISGKQGFQLWTIPRDGTYRITAAGAAGGSPLTVTNGWGFGAFTRGNFYLTEGEKLVIIVGHRGAGTASGDSTSSTSGGGGGGGASWVLKEDFGGSGATAASLYLVGGGGGGGKRNSDSYTPATLSDGLSSQASLQTSWTASSEGPTYDGGGGASYGINGLTTTSGGVRPYEGAAGGYVGHTNYINVGGFGGGGGNGAHEGGGGGGYVGGNASTAWSTYPGAGGSSRNNGSSVTFGQSSSGVTNTSGGDGYVYIEAPGTF